MGFTHFDKKGRAVMVDVTEKKETYREAVAKGKIKVTAEVLRAVKEGRAAKGDVLACATVAGIMGAKQTSQLIPMCHPLPISKCAVDWRFTVHVQSE